VGLDFSYTMVTMTTKLFTVGSNDSHGNQVGLDCLCSMATNLFAIGQNDPKGVAGFRHKGSIDIF
jgi:hypothetical protein